MRFGGVAQLKYSRNWYLIFPKRLQQKKKTPVKKKSKK